MAEPPQTFRPSLGTGPSIVFLAIGALLLGLVAYEEIRGGTPGRGAGPMVLLACVPGTVFAGRGLGLLRNAGTVTVDDDGVRLEGPLGRHGVRWADVVGHDVIRTEANGVRLFLRDGGRFALPFLGHADDGLYEAVHRRLAALPPPDVEGRVFRQRNRGAALVGTLAFLGLFLAGGLLAPPRPQGHPLVPFEMLLVVLGPLALWGMTDRAVLKDGVLTQGSVFETTRLPLAEVVEAELNVVSEGRSGKVEKLVLTGRKDDVTLEPRYDGYALLRDAVIAGLRPTVRPRPLSAEGGVRPAVRLKVVSARPQAEVEDRVFRHEQCGLMAFVLVIATLFVGFCAWAFARRVTDWVACVPPLLIVAVLAGVAGEHAVLQGGTLTVFSGYRRQRIDLATVRRAELRTVTRGSVRRECLFLVGPDGRETEVPSRLADSTRLVDAVLARLPTSMTFTG